jgi:formate C-acetyltransferase
MKSSKKFRTKLNKRYVRCSHTKQEKEVFLKDLKKKTKVYAKATQANAFYQLLSQTEICAKDRYFFYSVDVFKTWFNEKRLMVNSTLDYKRIIDAPINTLLINDSADFFTKENNKVVKALSHYLERCISFVNKSNMANSKNIIYWLENMKTTKASSLEEALQRILFINQIQWQTNHRLVGLGRLDYILNDLYNADCEAGRLDKDRAVIIIKEFLTCLHEYYWFKSDDLMGDTGQIIILGGNQIDGSYFCNELTYAFITAVKELQRPDPKVLLRVGENMPENLMRAAVDCIQTGIGCPLLSNDEQVIPYMIAFGYEPEDAYNYVTSACWEPLVPSVAHEQNNIQLINFLIPFNLMSEKVGFAQFDHFEKLFESYLQQLEVHISYVGALLDKIEWDKNPFVSAFTDSCRQQHKDVGDGGGKYNNYGILSLALSNAVNALKNIQKYVFEEKRITLCQLDFMRKNNFRGHEDIYQLFRNTKVFGTDDPFALELTNRILARADIAVQRYQNKFGAKAKFGLSSPGYIKASERYSASFDGRKKGEPFAVHISSDGNNGYTELMQFASKIDYSSSKFNGNVVDFFISPHFIQNNFEKFVSFIRKTISLGVFQMQANVVSRETLIAARENPDKFPNLIVRVWGFSAYYIDLPAAYKNHLIERAIQGERAS